MATATDKATINMEDIKAKMNVIWAEERRVAEEEAKSKKKKRLEEPVVEPPLPEGTPDVVQLPKPLDNFQVLFLSDESGWVWGTVLPEDELSPRFSSFLRVRWCAAYNNPNMTAAEAMAESRRMEAVLSDRTATEEQKKHAMAALRSPLLSFKFIVSYILPSDIRNVRNPAKKIAGMWGVKD